MKAFYIFTALLFKMSIGMAQNELPIVYEINKDTSVYRIDTTQFQILEDIEGKYSIEDVQNEAVAQGFHYDKNFNRNRTASTYWVRMRIKNNLNYEKNLWLFFNFGDFFDVYIFNEKDQIAHLKSGDLLRFSEIDGKEGDKPRFRIPFSIDLNQEIVIYERLNSAPWHQSFAYIYPAFESDEYRKEILYEGYRVDEDWREFLYGGIMIGILLLAACYNLLTYFSIKDKVYLYFGLCLLFFILDRHGENLKATLFREIPYVFSFFSNFFKVLFFYFFVQFIRKFLQKDKAFKGLHFWIIIFMSLSIFISILLINVRHYSMGLLAYLDFFNTLFTRITYILVFILNYKMWKQKYPYAHFSLLAITPIFLYWTLTFLLFLASFILDREFSEVPQGIMPYIESGCLTWLIIVFSATLVSRFNQIQKKVAAQEIERTKLVERQKELLEKQVVERTIELQNSLVSLQAAQNQLIQKEKLASLGELTAGIAHEIQNPLNFVNNFSELSVDLVKDLKDELERPEKDETYIDELFTDLTQNQEKINHHGKRASSIVKGMLEHSRTSTGVRELTDINALADEYLRLSYHGLRAKDKSFNATMETDFQDPLSKIEIIPQDIGRVLLNLYNNAFHAVNERAKAPQPPKGEYIPMVTVRTRLVTPPLGAGGLLEIRVKDNGTGMPESVKAKIFQPFFTTKPTGEGTGLGLSLAYDIVTKGHGGTLEVVSTEGVGTEFIIKLPLK